MSKNLGDRAKGKVSLDNKDRSRNFVVDNNCEEVITSLPAVGTGVRISGKKNLNFVGALIKTMYERGEINEKTFVKSMEKLSREATRYER